MSFIAKDNPFIKIFYIYSEQILSRNLERDIVAIINDFFSIDDEEITHYMVKELGNTLSIYESKIKNDSLQTITLKIDAPDDEYFIPSVILASAYDNVSIKKTYSLPHHPLLPETNNLYHELSLGKSVFSEYGGCDIDIVSDILFNIVSLSDTDTKEIFNDIQKLVIIKIFELLYNTCAVIVKDQRFLKLPKNMPFTFFAHLDEYEYISLITFH